MIKKPLVISAVLCALPTIGLAQSCENLSSFSMENMQVDATEVVAAGSFSPTGANASSAQLYQSLPEFCRVSLTLTPSPDSDIKMELWLPTQSWNGKYLAVGNGAFTGNVPVSYTHLTLPTICSV